MNKLIFSFIVVITFTQCSKKTTGTIADGSKPKMEHAWRSSAPSAAPARAIELGNYEFFKLPSGLNVIVVENHKLPMVSYQVSLANDPIKEGDMAGYVSIAGDMLTKGTKTRSKAQIDAEIDFIGANLSSSGSGMFASSLKKHSPKLLELFTDVLYNPVFPKEEFDKIKSQTLSALAGSKADPNAMATNVSNILLYGKDHPYGEIQTEKTVNNTTLEKCMEYYNTYFKPNNAYLVIVGDITLMEAKAQAEKYFGKWKGGQIPPVQYSTPKEPKDTRVSFVNKDGAVQSVVKVTYPIELTPGSPDEIAGDLMNSILGGGIFLGRLMQNLREDKAYTYGARSSLNSDELIGSFSAGASVRNAVTDSSVHEIFFELNRLLKEPVSEDDLRLVKNSEIGGFARSLEEPQTIARFALNTFKYNLPADYYKTYLSKLETVTVADIQRVSKKFIRPENAHIVVVGSKDEVADKLKRFDADGKIDYYDAFGEVLNYDNVALPAGVTGKTVVEDYIQAIGGNTAVKGLKSLKTMATMNIMGQEANVTTYQDVGKYAMSMEVQGMKMQEQILNGDKAMMGGMGQKKVLTSADEGFKDIKKQARIINQLDYFSNGYKLDLKGTEDIDGVKAYKLVVTDEDGKSVTEYYSMKDNLLIRSVSTDGEGEKMTIITTEVRDYRDTNGVKLPYSITILGAAPFPLEMKMTTYEVNKAIDPKVFTIE